MDVEKGKLVAAPKQFDVREQQAGDKQCFDGGLVGRHDPDGPVVLLQCIRPLVAWRMLDSLVASCGTSVSQSSRRKFLHSRNAVGMPIHDLLGEVNARKALLKYSLVSR